MFSTGATSLQAIDAAWIQTIQTALSLDKNNATVYAILAQYQWKKGLGGAEKNFEKALQLEPGTDIARRKTGGFRRASPSDGTRLAFPVALEYRIEPKFQDAAQQPEIQGNR